ncbi:dTDP-4-dehydrorhamnose 3,5-epimerase [Leadbetterella byssophila]|uniref:dTDP-4-dehydrorhamnose 3,5-epimerase n=1 Tax=Leadbetterella byssophila TaxID=316068 RepID=UPI0039A22AAE
MKIIDSPFDKCIIIKPSLFEDDRGYFFESFNEQRFNNLTGADVHFVQDNQSSSYYGVLRGLHFQKDKYAQAKLVRVLKGEVFDVAVDLRPESVTYGKWHGVILSAKNKLQFFIPRGFAHGFVVLSDTAEFCYKCDNYYNKEAESGVHYADPELAIDWHVSKENLIVSDKDKILPFLAQL